MSEKDGFKFSYALSIASQLGFIIASSILGFVLLGVWADTRFQTAPLFMLVGIFVGITITVYETYHLLLPLIITDTDHD